MIKIFVLDVMHLGYIGVMKKLLVDYWMEGNLTVRLSRIQKKELSIYTNRISKKNWCFS